MVEESIARSIRACENEDECAVDGSLARSTRVSKD